jgi:hypothetical protein
MRDFDRSTAWKNTDDGVNVTSRIGWAMRAFDFIQLKNGPFDLDLVFAPDGIERFADAWQRHVEIEGFPVCHVDDIISSKAATNRQKDRELLPRLESFRVYLRSKGEL